MSAVATPSYPPVAEMTPGQLLEAMKDPMWRLQTLYWIKTKTESEEDDDDGLVVKFRPNRYQRRLLRKLHFRNIILKARQLGFTTLIQIFFLDCALVTPNVRCGVIAHTDEAALKIFKKIKFAYDRLPDAIKAAVGLKTCNAHEMELTNGSVITVGTSMRSDTIHYLHISEFGKICAQFPHRAEEVITGTIPAVPNSGMIFIESTAEGSDGPFYKMCQRAEGLLTARKVLTPKEYRFHFFPWHDADEYRIDPAGVIISERDSAYFDQTQAKLGKIITPDQRAWWVSTRDNDFAGEDSKMWQEYPSSPEEAFQQSTAGTYYAKQIAAARMGSRFTTVNHFPGVPVNTFWDIGHSDGTAIWFHQRVGMRDHFIKFIEGWGESYSHFVTEMQKTGWVWGRHYLPHDGAHVRQGEMENLSPQQMLEKLGLRNVEIVPVVAELQHGIQQTRTAFANCYFDEAGCKEGLIHLEMYRKAWNTKLQCFSSHPLKDIHTEAADAFRQFAQGYQVAAVPTTQKRTRNWRTN